MINLLIAIAILVLPTIITLHILGPAKPFKIIYTLFLLYTVAERIWENFFTSKERNARKYEGDWCLVTVSTIYIVMFCIAIFEFYLSRHNMVYWISLTGLTIYTLALSLRWWGMKTLALQWGIHVVGTSKLSIQGRYLIQNGPYRFIRHPIYSGAILDALGIPLILNSFYTLFLSICIFVPVEILRAYLEERTLLKIFGEEYKQYKREVRAFLPFSKSECTELK